LRIEVADPQHALVLYGSPAHIGAEDSWERSTWQLVVPQRLDDGSQLSRTQVADGGSTGALSMLRANLGASDRNDPQTVTDTQGHSYADNCGSTADCFHRRHPFVSRDVQQRSTETVPNRLASKLATSNLVTVEDERVESEEIEEPIILGPAHRHGVSEDDMLHALRLAIHHVRQDDDMVMFIGPDTSGNELVESVWWGGELAIVHAMRPARDKYRL
jgi:hypothetical protein